METEWRRERSSHACDDWGLEQQLKHQSLPVTPCPQLTYGRAFSRPLPRGRTHAHQAAMAVRRVRSVSLNDITRFLDGWHQSLLPAAGCQDVGSQQAYRRACMSIYLICRTLSGAKKEQKAVIGQVPAPQQPPTMGRVWTMERNARMKWGKDERRHHVTQLT